MNETSKKALDAILQKHETKKQATATSNAAQQRKVDEMAERFAAIRESVIRPTMEGIGEQLRSKGHDYMISDELASAPDVARPRLIFHLFVDSYRGRDPGNQPFIQFISEGSNVQTHQSTNGARSGGSAGTVGNPISVDAITSDWVEEKVVAFIQKVFAGGW